MQHQMENSEEFHKYVLS